METEKPRRKSGTICPFMNKDVSKVCHNCELYIQVKGIHPQTGETIDHWGCSISFLPMLMIENSKMQRETGAAVESFRNEMVKVSQPLVIMQRKLNAQQELKALEDGRIDDSR